MQRHHPIGVFADARQHRIRLIQSKVTSRRIEHRGSEAAVRRQVQGRPREPRLIDPGALRQNLRTGQQKEEQKNTGRDRTGVEMHAVQL